MRTRYLIPAAIIITLTLAGCGSDGGGPGVPPAATTTSSGFVSKGIIKAGKVVAQELDAQGRMLREVGNATTGLDGAYQLTIGNGYAGGSVLFTLSATGDTKMVCDVQPRCAKVDKNFGEDFTVLDADPNFKMTAIISGATAGDKLTVQITPFTHMAAQYALARLPALPAGTTPAKAVDEANSEVNNLLGGVDVLRSRPRNLANAGDMKEATATEKAYALLTGAIGKLALGDTTGPGLTEAVRILAESFKEGKIKANEGTSPVDNRYSLKEILDAAKDQRASLGLSDDSGVLADLDQKIITAGTGDIDPQPSPLAGDTRIAKAKGLVQDMRTWGNQLQSLEGPAKVFANEIEMADRVTQPFQGPLGESLANGVVLMMSAYGSATPVSGAYGVGSGTHDLNTVFGAGRVVGSGNIMVSSAGGQTTLRLVGTLGLAGGGTSETLDLNLTLPAPASSIISLVAGLTGTVENSGAKLMLTEGSVTASFNQVITQDSASGVIESALQNASLRFSATLAEVGPEPVSFTGATQFDVVRCGSCSPSTINPALIKLSGALNKGAKNFSATVQADLSNASSFDPNQPEGGANVAKGTLTLSLSAKLDSLPEAQFTLVVRRTGYEASTNANMGDASLTIAYGGRNTRVEASKLSTASGTASLTFTSQDSVKLAVSGMEDAQEGKLTLDGAELGTVKRIGGVLKVTYNDGTFETIN